MFSSNPNKIRRIRLWSRRFIIKPPPPPSQPLTDNLESDIKQNTINPLDAVRLERDVLGMKSAVLRSLPISDSGETFQGSRFLPPAPGLRWVQLTSTLPTYTSNPNTGNPLDSAKQLQEQRRVCNLSFAIALPKREVCESSWKAWRGSGSMFGINYTSTVMSPMQPVKIKTLSDEKSKTNKKARFVPKQEGMLLPVLFSIRHYRYSELLRLPLLAASGTGIGRQAIAQFLTHFHMIRHSQPSNTNKNDDEEEDDDMDSNLDDIGGRRPPQILHTWEMPSTIDGKSPFNGEQNVLGIDYESSLTDESPPRRHALTLMLDSGPADSVLEVCVSAPAMSWDGLWEGDEEEALAQSIGVAGRGGLATITESFTVLNEKDVHVE